MITWIWIEGDKLFDEYCMKRFKQRPRFTETCSQIYHKGGVTRIRLTYKYREDLDLYVAMFLLYMDAPQGAKCTNCAYTSELSDIQRMSYEEIKADRTAILKR